MVCPSARPPQEAEKCLSKWREMGYKLALWRDDVDDPAIAGMRSDLWMTGDDVYPGYAVAVNDLVRAVLNMDPTCDWIVAAGDDTLPDPSKRADEISDECIRHFRPNGWRYPSTFGVMQPTGDRWGEGLYPNAHAFEEGPPANPNRCKRCNQPSGGVNHCVGANIDRVAGSPWLGREWCLRANQGKGPLWPYFFHGYADETLQCVAQKLGVFWQRPDLTHLHQHWARPKPGQRIGQVTDMPEFAKQANSPEEEKRSKTEFERLRAGGFAECLPL
jgi:hypothetical protein